ncbi:MAG: TlyA family RNA methyltransferase [Propioniciclava sp.]
MTRLDVALVQAGLARSRAQAADLIARGRVRVDGRPAVKASLRVGPQHRIDADVDPYVSRAAHKLIGALDAGRTEVPPRALDAGASTGGFTQVLLERGCQEVIAVDVGHGQLVPALREDPRVRMREGLHLRDLTLSDVDGEPVPLLVADVSFISLRLLLAPLLSVVADGGVALLLVKPQFELDRAALDSRGVVVDPDRARGAVERVAARAAELGWGVSWQGPTLLSGEQGNQEYFLKLERAGGAGGNQVVRLGR